MSRRHQDNPVKEYLECDGKKYKILTKFVSYTPSSDPNYPVIDEWYNPDVAFEKKLGALECPFTWNMESLIKTINTKECDIMYGDWYSEQPCIMLFPCHAMMRLLEAYAFTKLDRHSIALKHIEITKKTTATMDIRKDLEGLSEKAFIHILEATRCHVLASTGKKKEAEKVLKSLKNPKTMTEEEKNTILGFRAFAWLAYWSEALHKGEEYIRRAIDGNPDNALWRFILGKHLRRARLNEDLHGQPSEKEKSCFRIAYEKHLHPKLAIFSADMFAEYGEKEQALIMYKDTLYNSITQLYFNDIEYLMMAKSLTKIGATAIARQCFDRLQTKWTNNHLCLHVKGLFFKMLEEYAKAAFYLEKSMNMPHITVIEEYCYCMLKIDPTFDVLQYLLISLNSYEHMYQRKKQRLYIHIAMEYYEMRHIPDALKYFRLALNANNTSMTLRHYATIRAPNVIMDVIKFLQESVLVDVEWQRQYFEQKTQETLFDIEFICECDFWHREKLKEQVVKKQIKKISLRSRS